MYKYLIWIRAFIQFSVVALFCVLPWINLKGINQVSGNLFAFNFFGIPFADPAVTSQAALSGITAGSAPILAYYLGGLGALLVAFFLGRIFCGWLCPYGLLSSFISDLRPPSTKPLSLAKARHLFLIRLSIYAAALVLAAGTGYAVVSMLSMPGELSLLPLVGLEGFTLASILSLACLPILALLTELIAKRRLWCQYICPQSVLLSASAAYLPKTWPGLRISWDKTKCTCGKRSPCAQACTMNLNPRYINGPDRRDCIMCGDCVHICADHGKALNFTIKPPK